MSNTTAPAPISNLVKDNVLDAMQAARSALRRATNADRHADDTVAKASANLEFIEWAAELVRLDQNDSLLALRIGGVIVALEDLAPTLSDSTEMRAAADRLRLASLLLFSARRERDLAARLKAILPMAQTLAEYAEERIEAHGEAHPNVATGTHDLDTARNIARLARA